MKKYILSLLMLCMGGMLYAQKVSRTYQNVSMSDVLRDLNKASDDYTVNFMYNELEDFRVTTKIHRKSIPEAIQQAIGFYPIRIVKRGENELYVECSHKTDRHLTGTIIDEQGQPVAYANIAILNPTDSTLLSGGVSNESGYFAIPYEQHKVLARISYVGYKTIYKICSQPEVGTIRLQPETVSLKGVTVKVERIVSTTENGHLVYNMPMLLQVYPADNAYDALTNIPGVSEMNGSIMFSGRTVTLIINGKPTTLSADKVVERLKQMPAAMLAKAEVMPSAPAKYHVRGIRTTDGRLATAQVRYWICGWQRHL